MIQQFWKSLNFFFFDCEEKNIVKGNPPHKDMNLSLLQHIIIWYTRRDTTFFNGGENGGGGGALNLV